MIMMIDERIEKLRDSIFKFYIDVAEKDNCYFRYRVEDIYYSLKDSGWFARLAEYRKLDNEYLESFLEYSIDLDKFLEDYILEG